jgi:hypothetical protein
MEDFEEDDLLLDEGISLSALYLTKLCPQEDAVRLLQGLPEGEHKVSARSPLVSSAAVMTHCTARRVYSDRWFSRVRVWNSQLWCKLQVVMYHLKSLPVIMSPCPFCCPLLASATGQGFCRRAAGPSSQGPEGVHPGVNRVTQVGSSDHLSCLRLIVDPCCLCIASALPASNFSKPGTAAQQCQPEPNSQCPRSCASSPQLQKCTCPLLMVMLATCCSCCRSPLTAALCDSLPLYSDDNISRAGGHCSSSGCESADTNMSSLDHHPSCSSAAQVPIPSAVELSGPEGDCTAGNTVGNTAVLSAVAVPEPIPLSPVIVRQVGVTPHGW